MNQTIISKMIGVGFNVPLVTRKSPRFVASAEIKSKDSGKSVF